MTDCPDGDMRDLLPDLLHERLAPDVRREVESHVRGCDECRAELALLGEMRSALRRAPAVDAAAIAAAIPPYRAPARRGWGGWRAAAAIVVLVAGGTSVAVLQSRHAAPRELALGSPAVSDLDDGELSTLLAGLQTLDAVPSADVETIPAISPFQPTGTD